MSIDWDESLNTGVEEMDADHRGLISLANSVQAAGQAGNQEDVLRLALEFSSYCDDHFVMEEEFMRDIGYPQRMSHKSDHDQMLADLDKIIGHVHSNIEASTVMADFIYRWTANHMQVFERQLAEFVCARGDGG